MSKVYVNDGYMMLLDAIYFNGKKIGNVSDDGIDWGGDAAEYIKLFAAQVRNAPVKKIKKKDATNLLKFSYISKFHILISYKLTIYIVMCFYQGTN